MSHSDTNLPSQSKRKLHLLLKYTVHYNVLHSLWWTKPSSSFLFFICRTAIEGLCRLNAHLCSSCWPQRKMHSLHQDFNLNKEKSCYSQCGQGRTYWASANYKWTLLRSSACCFSLLLTSSAQAEIGRSGFARNSKAKWFLPTERDTIILYTTLTGSILAVRDRALTQACIRDSGLSSSPLPLKN